MEYIASFTSAALAGGLLVFAQFLITRHDNKKGFIAEFREAIAEIRREQAEERMIVRRRYIFDFSKEVRMGVRHTEEEWGQLNKDISEYERYCKENPEFVNKGCDIAVENLEEIYKKVWKENDFA